MKPIIILASTLLLFFNPSEETAIDRIGVKGPLTFNKTDFKLAWTDHPNHKYYIQEYLPGGETMEAFNQMLTIHVFDSETKLKDAVKQKVNELTERKKTDPLCNYAVNESPGGKEFMVDFLLGESKNNELSTVEFNIYRYKQVNLTKNKKGILVYAYSKRAYGEKIKPFLESLGADRTTYLNEMIKISMPTITIESK